VAIFSGRVEALLWRFSTSKYSAGRLVGMVQILDNIRMISEISLYAKSISSLETVTDIPGKVREKSVHNDKNIV
jgi:hypothetical protein